MSKIGMCSALLLCAGLSAQTAIAENDGFDRTDYTDLDTWLCHPDKADDACEIDLTATAIQADGSTEIVPFEVATDPSYDCFYYYPTVSFDVTPNSDLEPGIEELNVIAWKPEAPTKMSTCVTLTYWTAGTTISRTTMTDAAWF